MDVSICIVNWNTRDLLDACLASLAAYPPSVPHDIWVADNASGDGSAELVEDKYPACRLVRTGANLGFAGGNNVLLRRATGRYLLLLNPDTEINPRLDPAPIDRLVAHLAREPWCGAVSARLVQPDGQTQQSCRSFPEPWPLLWEWSGLWRLSPRLLGGYRLRAFDHETSASVDQPMASCLLVRRTALRDVGLFDEQFPIFFNDVDLALRLRAAGWRLDYLASASILHLGGGTTRLVKRRMVIESRDSLLRLYAKHYRQRLAPLTYHGFVALIKAAFALRLGLLSRR